ncbi:MAG: hypothetical protein WCP97_08570 [bacterium]
MNEYQHLEQEINTIKERNAKVEIDKAWETSLLRKLLIAVLTYGVLVVFFLFAGLPKPFINAIVPAVSFVLSTMSVPLVKKLWVRYWFKK